jgi:hypothetical protein
MVTKISDITIYMFGKKIDTTSVKCTVIWDVKIQKEIDKVTLKFSFENIFGYFVTKKQDGLEKYAGFDFDIDDSWNISVVRYSEIISPNGIIINFDEKLAQLKF